MATSDILIRIRGDSSGLTTALGSARSNVSRFATEADRAGRTAGTGMATVDAQVKKADSSLLRATKAAGGFALAFAGYKAVGLISDAVKLEATYSKTMREIAIAAEAPTAQMERLDDLAMKLGADTIFSANDAASAMLELAKNGLSPATIEAGALDSALTLAAAGSMDLTEASKAMGNTLNAFNIEGKNSAEVANALAGAANASSASVSDLTQGLQQVSSGAADAGFTVQETTATLAAFANAGIQGSDAGTTLKTMLTRLIPMTNTARDAFTSYGLSGFAAKGSMEKLAQLGIEPLSDKFGDIRQAIGEYVEAQQGMKVGTDDNIKATDNLLYSTGIMSNAFVKQNGEFKDMADIAEVLKDRFGGMSDSERTAALSTIFGSDARRAATQLMNQGREGMEKYIKATSDQTQAEKLAKAAMDGTSGAMEQLKGQFENAQLQIGKGLAPLVIEGADALGDALSSRDLEADLKNFIGWAKDIYDDVQPLAEDMLPLLAEGAELVGGMLKVAVELGGGFAKLLSDIPGPAQKVAFQVGAAAIAFGKIKSVFAGSQLISGLSTFSTDMQTAATRTARLQGAAKSAAGMAGVGLLVASFQEADDGLSNLETIAGGALTGFGVAGPWGAAVGAVAGLATAFIHVGDEAENAKPDVADFTDTLDKLTGSTTAATRELAARTLEDSGLLQLGADFGFEGSTLVDAVVGSPENAAAAYARLNKLTAGIDKRVAEASDRLEAAREKIDPANGMASDADMAAFDAAQAHYDAVTASVAGTRAGIAKLTDGIVANRDELTDTIAEQKRLTEATRGGVVSAKDYRAALADLPKEARTAFRQEGMEAGLKDIEKLTQRYKVTPGQVETLVKALGIDTTERRLKGLQDNYGLTPKEVQTLLKADDSDANRDTDALQKKYDLTTREIKTVLKADSTDANRKIDETTGRAIDLSKTDPVVKTAAVIVETMRDLTSVITKTDDLSKTNPVVKSSAETATTMRDLNATIVKSNDLGRTDPLVKVSADTTDANRKIDEFARNYYDMRSGITGKSVTFELTSQAAKIADQLGFIGVAEGGPIPGHLGTRGRDSVPAALMPDEHVFTTAEVKAAGKGDFRRGHEALYGIRKALLSGIFDGPLAGYAGGGPVLAMRGKQSGVPESGRVIQSMFDTITGGLTRHLSAEGNKYLTSMGRWQFPLARGSYSIGGGLNSYPGHTGQDLPASLGTPIFAPSGGRVSQSLDLATSYGRHVYLEHAGGIQTRHAHMLQRGVNTGETVRPGQPIGLVDSTGNSTGNHLHTEVLENGALREPLDFYRSRGVSYDSGGKLQPGTTIVHNNTGKPENVLTDAQLAAIQDQRQDNRDALRELNQGLRELTKGLRQFGVNVNDSAAETRAEVRALIQQVAAVRGRDSVVVENMQKLAGTLTDVARAQDQASAKFDRASDRLDRIREASQQYADTVSNAYRHDPFGGSLADFSLQLRADRNDARDVKTDLQRLDRRGLSGSLQRQLQASGNAQLIDQLSHQSPRQIRQYEKLFRSSNTALRRLGGDSAQALYHRDIKESIRERQHARKVMERLNDRLGNLEKRIESGAYRGVRDGTRERNHRANTLRKGRR